MSKYLIKLIMRDKYKHTKSTPELNEKIIKLFDEGWHVPAIKKETGASDSYVRNLIRSTGRSTKRSYQNIIIKKLQITTSK